MPPLRAKMIYQMHLERLAPKPQAAYVAAVAGVATFSHRSPDQLSPEQIRRYLPPLLVDRHRAWRSGNHVAWGSDFSIPRPWGGSRCLCTSRRARDGRSSPRS